MSDADPLPHHASVEVHAKDPQRAQALVRSLQVEASDPLGGAQVHIVPGDEAIRFKVEVRARDLVHLRAALNSFLKWLDAADSSIQAAETTRRG